MLAGTLCIACCLGVTSTHPAGCQHIVLHNQTSPSPPPQSNPPSTITSCITCCCDWPHTPPHLPTRPLPSCRDQPQIIDYVRLKGQATALQGSVADMRRKVEVAAGAAATVRRGTGSQHSGSAASTKRSIGASAGTLKSTIQ